MSQGTLKDTYKICFSIWAAWNLFSFFFAHQFLFSSMHHKTSLYLFSSLLHLLRPFLLVLIHRLCSHPFQYICFSISCQPPALLRLPKELLDKLSTGCFFFPRVQMTQVFLPRSSTMAWRALKQQPNQGDMLLLTAVLADRRTAPHWSVLAIDRKFGEIYLLAMTIFRELPPCMNTRCTSLS